MHLGVFGGSFDPPHVGHVSICAMTLALTDVDELLVVPTYEHALGKRMTAFEHRLAMCVLAFSELRRARVTDLERRLGGTSYTYRTLEHLAAAHPGARLSLVVGADALRDRESWQRFHEVERLAELVVFGRSGVLVDRATLPEPPGVAAAEVRRRVASGEPVDRLVPRTVLGYLAAHGLYG